MYNQKETSFGEKVLIATTVYTISHCVLGPFGGIVAAIILGGSSDDSGS